MELRQLQCFMAVAERGGIKRAAPSLHISQPAISYQLRKLERDLGATLLQRSPQGISLTAAGRELRGHARNIFLTLDKAEAAARAATQMGRLEIGSTLPALSFIANLIKDFHDSCPDVRLAIRHGHCGELIEALLASKIHLVFAAASESRFSGSHELLVRPFSIPIGELNDVDEFLFDASKHSRGQHRSSPSIFLITLRHPSTCSTAALIDQFCSMAVESMPNGA